MVCQFDLDTHTFLIKKTFEISNVPVRESVPKTKLNKGISTTLIDVI